LLGLFLELFAALPFIFDDRTNAGIRRIISRLEFPVFSKSQKRLQEFECGKKPVGSRTRRSSDFLMVQKVRVEVVLGFKDQGKSEGD
jgi:hypothetical protein